MQCLENSAESSLTLFLLAYTVIYRIQREAEKNGRRRMGEASVDLREQDIDDTRKKSCKKARESPGEHVQKGL